MKIVFFLNVVSPHQLPLAREVAKLVGEENFRYIYTEDFLADRKAMGWNDGDVPQWCMKGDDNVPELLDADLVYTGIRCLSLMARRSAMGKKTLYYSERWFKPGIGVLRLISASFRRMAREFVRLMDEGGVVYLSSGIHAARDMARLCGLMHGDLRCLFCAPKLEFEKRPNGRLVVSRQSLAASVDRYCLDKMRMWGYYVEKSVVDSRQSLVAGGLSGEDAVKFTTPSLLHTSILKVLWVGRLLKLKRVDTIIRAVQSVASRQSAAVSLDIYGTGPEEVQLKKMAAKYGDIIKFYPSVPIDEVRKLMREHDVYVLSSNGYEGWGAVVSEALEEGMKVIGTYEAGASATMLPKESLYSCGDWRSLSSLLIRCIEAKSRGLIEGQGIGDWTAEVAAKKMVELAE